MISKKPKRNDLTVLNQNESSAIAKSGPVVETIYTGFNFKTMDVPYRHEGLVYDLHPECYHPHSSLNKGKAVIFEKSPTRYWYELIRPAEQKRVYDMGSCFHDAVQYGLDFLKEHYVKLPVVDRRTNAGKQEVKEFLENQRSNQCIIEPEDWDIIMQMRDSVLLHKDIKELMDHQDTTFEGSFFWIDPLTGVAQRGRYDLYNSHTNILLDFKSIDSKLSWIKSVDQRSYHLQEWSYRQGMKEITGVEPNFYFSVTPKSKNLPYTQLEQLSDRHMFDQHRGAKYRYSRILENFAEVSKTKRWFEKEITPTPFYWGKEDF